MCCTFAYNCSNYVTVPVSCDCETNNYYTFWGTPHFANLLLYNNAQMKHLFKPCPFPPQATNAYTFLELTT